jgi:Holliday junction resolvase RusA-like endonuclease
MVTYTPKATQQYEELVALHARAAVAQARWEHDGNVYVEVAISKGGVVVLVEPSDRDRFWHADVDNYAKSLMDGMEGIVYGNDRRVVDLAVYFEEKS